MHEVHLGDHLFTPTRFFTYILERSILTVFGIGLLYIPYIRSFAFIDRVIDVYLYSVFELEKPPIMLEAGYNLPKKAFFDNIGTILSYAVLGTLFNAFAIGFSLYGAYQIGLMPGIDDDHEKNLGILETV